MQGTREKADVPSHSMDSTEYDSMNDEPCRRGQGNYERSKSMSRKNEDLRDFLRLIYYAADEIQYALSVQSYDDCNTCGRKHCRYMPKPGAMVRINCPLWKEQEHDSSKSV